MAMALPFPLSFYTVMGLYQPTPRPTSSDFPAPWYTLFLVAAEIIEAVYHETSSVSLSLV